MIIHEQPCSLLEDTLKNLCHDKRSDEYINSYNIINLYNSYNNLPKLIYIFFYKIIFNFFIFGIEFIHACTQRIKRLLVQMESGPDVFSFCSDFAALQRARPAVCFFIPPSQRATNVWKCSFPLPEIG